MQPVDQVVEQGPGLVLARRGTAFRSLAAVLLFDRIQRRDPLERLGRDRRALRLVDIEELASHVRQARDLADGTGADESLEARVAVGVHPAGEASQMLLGVMGLGSSQGLFVELL